MRHSGEDELPLPMPMTPFEEYMHGDDHRAYPMIFFVRLRFAGKVDRLSFERALRTAVERHCLLSATLREATGETASWHEAGVGPPVRWHEKTGDTSYPPIVEFDLSQSPGLAVTVLSDDLSSDIVLQFHHACCDGAGAFALVNDLMIAYAIEQADHAKDAVLKPLDAARLAERNRCDLTTGRILKMIPKQAIGLLGVRQFLMRHPTSLSGRQPVPLDQSPPTDYPRVNVLYLSSDVSKSIRDTARRHNVTPNHLFVSDLFLAINDWRSEFGHESDRWIRFSIPINLRTEKDHSMPAANKVSMVFLDRRREHFSEPIRLLHGIRDETQLIARNRLEFMFLLSLWLTRRFRGNAAVAAKTDRCQSTTLLTNLGSPFDRSSLPKHGGKLVVGNLELQGFEVVAPLRPYTDVAFSIGEYARQFHVTLHWDPRAITQQQAETLLAGYETRLRRSSY